MNQITQVGDKFSAVINGKTIKRANRRALERMLKASGASVSEPTPSRFSINQRFGFVTDMVTMLAKGDQASVVITGPGGLGKSFTVSAALIGAGFNDLSAIDDLEPGDKVPKNSFQVIKGYSTAKGLFRTLYENRNSVIVFDDCDSILKDSVSLSLLKAALDSYSRRIISWRADTRDEELPNVFEFKGRVVFISNLPSASLDQAIITRSMAVDLSMTPSQKIDRMRFLLTQKDFMPEFDLVCKNDAMELIADLVDEVKELSLRTLIQVTKIRKSNPNGKWKDLAEYAIAG
jgi:hypothetical protein